MLKINKVYKLWCYTRSLQQPT